LNKAGGRCDPNLWVCGPAMEYAMFSGLDYTDPGHALRSEYIS